MKQDRIDALRAMDTIVKATGDEDYIMAWLMAGVPDGTETDDQYADLTDDETYSEIEEEFLSLMKQIHKERAI